MTQCGKHLWKKSICANQHPSLTISVWVVLDENAKRAKILWTITETCLNLGSPQEQQKSYPVQEDLTQISQHGPVIWKVMQRNVWRYCDLANKTTEKIFKVATPCMDNHQFKEEELGSVGELPNVCSLNVLKVLVIGMHW